jgi:hypothetical protein
MSRVINLHSAAQLHEVIAQQGYVVAIFVRAGNWACAPYLARSAEYSREYGFARFYIIDIDECNIVSVGNAPISYVPMTAFYRNGKPNGMVAGTDYANVEAKLDGMRKDGGAIAPVRATLAPGALRSSIGMAFRAQSTMNSPIFVTRRAVKKDAKP